MKSAWPGLTPRMRRAGLSNVYPMAIRDEKDNRIKRLRGKFDKVLIDAPCTGTGTLRRNPDLKWRLSPEELARINGLQHSILEEAAKLVKAGGRVVYATCSMLKVEDQDVVEAFLASHPEFELLNAAEVLAKLGIELPSWQTGALRQLLRDASEPARHRRLFCGCAAEKVGCGR